MKVFTFDNCDLLKKYKVYAIYEKDKIIYIGCTNKHLRSRMIQHYSNCIHWTPRSKKEKHFLNCYNKDIPLHIKCLYSFNTKIVANIVESLLINFYKKFIDPDILNSKNTFSEHLVLNPEKYNYCNIEEVI